MLKRKTLCKINYFVISKLFSLCQIQKHALTLLFNIKIQIRLVLLISLQLILMNHHIDVTSPFVSPIKSQQRNSCSTCFSEESYQLQDRLRSFDTLSENSKISSMMYFQPQIFQPQISVKLHKKAINVLFNVCWDKGLRQDCLWSSLMIYYSYKSKKLIKKIQLQKLVIVCVFISTKLICPQKISMKEIISITNGKYTVKQIKEMEGEILSALNFEINIQNYPVKTIYESQLNRTQIDEFLCLAQLLMIRNSDIFWKKQISDSIISFVKGNETDYFKNLSKQMVQMTKKPEGQIIIRKYCSKIDTQNLLNRLQNV